MLRPHLSFPAARFTQQYDNSQTDSADYFGAELLSLLFSLVDMFSLFMLLRLGENYKCTCILFIYLTNQ